MAVDVQTRPRVSAAPLHARAARRGARAHRRGALGREDVRHRQGEGARAPRGRPRGRARRDGRDHGPERLRQDHAAQLPLRSRRDRRRRGPDRGHAARARCPTGRARTTARGAWASSSSSTTSCPCSRAWRTSSCRCSSPAFRRERRAGGRSRRSSMVGLADWAEHVPDELSGGQRQRVTIARSLVNDPAIVWADEPTGDLDSENADEIIALMRTLNRERGPHVPDRHPRHRRRPPDRPHRPDARRPHRRGQPTGGSPCTHA